MDCLRCGVGGLGCDACGVLGCTGVLQWYLVFWLGDGKRAHVLSLLRRVLGVLWETAVHLAIYNGPSGARV